MWKKGLFGRKKLELVSSKRYTYHRDVGVCDKNGVLIFEGDIVKNPNDETFVGVVAYVPNHAAFFIFDDNANIYYRIDENTRNNMVVVDNIIENNKGYMQKTSN